MRNLLFVALLLNAVSAYAQNNPNASFKRVYIGISTTQGVTYRHITPGKDYKGNKYLKDRIRGLSRLSNAVHGYDAGIKLGVNISQHVSFETGLQYSYKGYEENYENMEIEVYNDFGWSEYYIVDAKYKYKFHYVDIPLQWNISIGKKKCRAVISTGININVLIKQSQQRRYFDLYSYNREYKSDLKKWYSKANFAPFLGIGIDYAITSFMNLRVMPMFQIQALQNNLNIFGYNQPLNDVTSNRLYSGGINVALNFGFVDTGAKHFKYTSVIGTKKNGKPKE